MLKRCGSVNEILAPFPTILRSTLRVCGIHNGLSEENNCTGYLRTLSLIEESAGEETTRFCNLFH